MLYTVLPHAVILAFILVGQLTEAMLPVLHELPFIPVSIGVEIFTLSLAHTVHVLACVLVIIRVDSIAYSGVISRRVASLSTFGSELVRSPSFVLSHLSFNYSNMLSDNERWMIPILKKYLVPQDGPEGSVGDSQLIGRIMESCQFQKIASKLQMIEVGGSLLPCADSNWVNLRIAEQMTSQKASRQKCRKLSKAVQRLKQFSQQMEISENVLQDKLQWMQAEADRYAQSIEEVLEQKEIMDHQNERTRKGVVKESRGSTDKQSQKELQAILTEYRCKSTFPKNKTEVLMLINSIESMIQQAEVRRMTNYEGKLL